MVLMLSRSDIKGLITMPEAIAALRQAHAEFSRGAAAMPQRGVIIDPEHEGFFATMPAYLFGSGAIGVKSVTVYKRNPSKGIPATLGLTLLLDPETGMPISVMDAGYLTGIRTAAASGVATSLLAREDARELAILGPGVQGRNHLIAITAVRPIERVRVYDSNTQISEKFREEMQPTVSADIQIARSAEEAVRGADVVVTTTTSSTPILEFGWLKPGAHVNGIGSHAPGVRELASDVIANSRVVVDSREAALAEAGDLQIPIAEGLVTKEQLSDELGEVVEGLKPGRTSPTQVTLYKSVGIAIQDMAVAAMVYRKALAQHVGKEVDLLS